MTRAAVYVRVSTREQAKGYSLAGQERECRAYCQRQAYSVTRILRDTESGRNMGRPVARHLVDLAIRGAFDVIVVWRRDRFGRHRIDTPLLEMSLSAAGIRIETIGEGPLADTAEIEYMHHMLDGQAHYESRKLGERSMMGKHQKAHAGSWPAAPPYGYTRQGNQLAAHPDQAAQIQRAYRACILGANRDQLGDLLGCGPHAAYARIQNPIYKGLAMWDGITFPCTPLVSAGLWQRAVDAIAARRHNRGGTHPAPYTSRWEANVADFEVHDDDAVMAVGATPRGALAGVQEAAAGAGEHQKPNP